MPSKGEIFFSSDFLFSDGTRGEKLFVVLNNPGPGEPYVVVKTTSHEPRKPYHGLCNPELKIFFIQAGHELFSKNTFIQLHEYFPFTDNDFLDGYFQHTMKSIGMLTSLCITQIINCIRKIKDDVPQKYFLLICR